MENVQSLQPGLQNDSTSDNSDSTFISLSTKIPLPKSGFAPLKPWLATSTQTILSIYCVVATFITYFAAAAFRKAVFAHSYDFVDGWFGTGMTFKTALSLMQTVGLLLSKISGIKYHSYR
jgi:hypothetical protein